MPYQIHVKGSSPANDSAAVVTAFNNLITALRALAGAKRVDAGGSTIGGVRVSGDELTRAHDNKPGETVQVKFYRDNKLITKQVRLGVRPASYDAQTTPPPGQGGGVLP